MWESGELTLHMEAHVSFTTWATMPTRRLPHGDFTIIMDIHQSCYCTQNIPRVEFEESHHWITNDSSLWMCHRVWWCKKGNGRRLKRIFGPSLRHVTGCSLEPYDRFPLRNVCFCWSHKQGKFVIFRIYKLDRIHYFAISPSGRMSIRSCAQCACAMSLHTRTTSFYDKRKCPFFLSVGFCAFLRCH